MREWFVLATPFITAFIGGIFTIIAAKGSQSKGKYIAWASVVVIIALVVTTYITWKPVDKWESWKGQVETDFKNSPGHGLYRLKAAIKNNPPPFAERSQSGSFYEDMKAGNILLSNNEIAEVLKREFGIYKSSFTGAGLSVPWDSEYSKSISREYLVKNVDESDSDVWTWILDPAFVNYSRKISELINSPPTTPSNTVDLASNISTVISRMRNPSSIPPVIRFQKFPFSKYSNMVGRSDSKYVFFSNLHDVWDLTVEEAAESSGYRLASQSSDAPDTKLFVWLYVPTHAHSVRCGTWRNVISILNE